MMMPNSKRSITFKVIGGYLIVAALAAVAVWFIYFRVIKFTKIAQNNNSNNEKLFLVSEITTGLYKTENISRSLIQRGGEEDISLYRSEIDSIKSNILKLREIYPDSLMQFELDSISLLLNRKTDNLETLTELRQQDRNTNYYTQVIKELEKVDESFADKNYNNRFKNLQPHQRSVLIKLLEFADDEKPLTKKSADSIIGSVKTVLTELEASNRRFRETLNEKEAELLDNDMILSQQLRNLLNKIEIEERQESLENTANSQQMLEETSTIILIGGILSILIILVFLFLIMQDVTRSQRYRMQLEEAKSFAESLLKSREQFMAAITHDLRSPLNTVIGYTELMQKTNLSNKQKHYLLQLKRSSDFILRLVNDLLDLSKLEAGKMLIEKLPFNPKKLITDTVQNSIPGNQEKNVEVVIDIPESLDVQVLSDPFRLKQIIANLVTNAYKFTEEGEIRVTAFLKQKIEDTYLLDISIKDTGIGISEEKKEMIFEEFSQENSGIEKKYGGSGLGLSITQRLTKLLNGDVKLNTELGEGSEFIISIPVIKLNKEVVDVLKSETTMLPKTDLKGKKVLVVDDEASQLSLTSELVKSLKMEADTCHNGAEAIKKLQLHDYDLVLTDIQMPIKDGFDLVKYIRGQENLKEIPVIALSGQTNVLPEVYKKAGFNKNLVKPYRPEELLKTISDIFKVEIKTNSKKPILNGKNHTTEYDLDEIFQFSGGDQKAMAVILKAFLESSKNNIIDIEKALNDNNYEEIGRVSHKMLPMLRQMKVEHVTPTLQKLEAHEEVSSGEIAKTIADLRTLLANLEAEITA